MKAKRITLLVSIISVILIFVILSSTVFSLNRVEFCFLEQPMHYKTDISNDVIESGKFGYGESVFLIDKQKHIDKIEKQYPYLKVVGIETKFPNVLLIQSIERQPFFAVPNENNSKIAICDEDFKVLRIINYTEYIANPVYPIIDYLDIEFNSESIGEFLFVKDNVKMLKQLPSIYEQIDYTSSEVGAMVKKFDITENKLKIISYNNYRIEIKEPAKFLTQKIALAYAALFGEEGVSEDFCGLIYVYQKNNEVCARTIENG